MEKESNDDKNTSKYSKTSSNIDKKILDRIIYDNAGLDNSETKIFDWKTLLNLRQDRLWSALKERYQYNTSIKRGQNFLLNHVNSKLDLVIMYADLVGSTKMSMTLPVEKLVTIIRAFSHELSSVIESYDGFVLKYVGDAIISFFPSGFNKYLTCDNSFRCAKSIIQVLKEGINPILSKYDYPELQVKIGIDEGENVAIQYGYDKSSQIDLLGHTMNVTAKITSVTSPNKISVGETVYKLLHPQIQTELEEVSISNSDWKYIDSKSGKHYKVYTTR